VSSVIGAPRSHRAGAGLVDRQARGVAGPFSAEVSTAAIPSTSELTAILAVRDLTERHRMEEALARSLREKETLLREVHHRVKNNLQIVSSLLTLQAEGLEQGTARDALTSSVYRVRSMSYVHQQLHNTDDPDSVELSAYARTLCTSLQSSLDPSAELAFALERVEVSIDQAIPVGLVLNELITNALKHGRSPDGRCRLFVEVRPHEGGAFVAITDDGPGFVPPRASSSLGMQLVRTLSRQVRGKLDIAKGGTTRPDGGVLSGARTTLWMPPPEVRPASLLPNGSA
jgi:two-component sensor histidine kinase